MAARLARAWIMGGLLVVGVANAADLRYVSVSQMTPGAVVVDTRAGPLCAERSFAGAHCLPATDLTGPGGELPSFPDLLWAFGTAGLSGKGTVVVAGDRPLARDFVAGLLYLAGQARVEILTAPLTTLLQAGRVATGPGRPRGMLRDPIYVAPMRDGLVELRDDLLGQLAGNGDVLPVDGRSAREFDGAVQDGGRAGRIPGAANLSLAVLYQPNASNQLQRLLHGNRGRTLVAYGSGPRDSVALFTRLRAAGGNVRVLIGGWRAWAAAPDFPVEAGTQSSAGDNGFLGVATVRLGGAVALAAGVLLLWLAMWGRKGKRWT